MKIHSRKYQQISVSEEPDEGKLSSPVLQTSTGGDPCTEFSTPHIRKKTSANGSLSLST